jgi:hypothetical protein
VSIHLFRYDNDFGTVDAFLDLERSEGIEIFGGVEVAATSAGDDVEAYYKCCVETLAVCQYLHMKAGKRNCRLTPANAMSQSSGWRF